jgi:hypothetical protein
MPFYKILLNKIKGYLMIQHFSLYKKPNRLFGQAPVVLRKRKFFPQDKRTAYVIQVNRIFHSLRRFFFTEAQSSSNSTLLTFRSCSKKASTSSLCSAACRGQDKMVSGFCPNITAMPRILNALRKSLSASITLPPGVRRSKKDGPRAHIEYTATSSTGESTDSSIFGRMRSVKYYIFLFSFTIETTFIAGIK